MSDIKVKVAKQASPSSQAKLHEVIAIDHYQVDHILRKVLRQRRNIRNISIWLEYKEPVNGFSKYSNTTLTLPDHIYEMEQLKRKLLQS